MPKPLKITILALIVLALAVFFLRFILGSPEDTWLCQNNEWIKHGNPSAPKPAEGCGPIQSQTEINVASPKPNDNVSSPIEVVGQARGSWYFEASFPVKLVDSQGQEIAFGIAQAQDDWMTENFVPFIAKIEFAVQEKTSANLILQKDNPSGLLENDQQIVIPVILAPKEKITVKVYFNSNNLDPEISCNKVFPVEREIPKTKAIARAALEELLSGLRPEEKANGYITNINSAVKIQKLIIEDGLAKVDFDQQLDFQVGGSCRVSAIRAQITETLKQFPTVKEVVISINGRAEDILQP